MADAHKGVASNFKVSCLARSVPLKHKDVQLKVMTCLKFPLAKWEAVNATSYMKGC